MAPTSPPPLLPTPLVPSFGALSFLQRPTICRWLPMGARFHHRSRYFQDFHAHKNFPVFLRRPFSCFHIPLDIIRAVNHGSHEMFVMIHNSLVIGTLGPLGCGICHVSIPSDMIAFRGQNNAVFSILSSVSHNRRGVGSRGSVSCAVGISPPFLSLDVTTPCVLGRGGSPCSVVACGT